MKMKQVRPDETGRFRLSRCSKHRLSRVEQVGQRYRQVIEVTNVSLTFNQLLGCSNIWKEGFPSSETDMLRTPAECRRM